MLTDSLGILFYFLKLLSDQSFLFRDIAQVHLLNLCSKSQTHT